MHSVYRKTAHNITTLSARIIEVMGCVAEGMLPATWAEMDS
jgi:hypothetical protein